MPRFTPTTPTPSYAPLPTRGGAVAVLVEPEEVAPVLMLTGHGKPLSALPEGARRLPARRASYRTPPR